MGDGRPIAGGGPREQIERRTAQASTPQVPPPASEKGQRKEGRRMDSWAFFERHFTSVSLPPGGFLFGLGAFVPITTTLTKEMKLFL
ncbi:hypothetical protein OPV22_030658 [Ensete ventricosum]|uniref:Uncharacterized protein n=1 Tax=Ensete ventricosum TaxID=4639 RepID=A0AAV8P797_ENSVE|nr:hypothetical protein OPV22_030658 [Ensete ventricosum]